MRPTRKKAKTANRFTRLKFKFDEIAMVAANAVCLVANLTEFMGQRPI